MRELTQKDLNKLYYNIRLNATSGGGGGKYKSALTKSGLTEEEVIEKLNRKKLEPKEVLIPHMLELWKAQLGCCYHTGIELNPEYLHTGNQTILAPSVDRIDNKRGYEVGNIKIVMRGINKFKNNTHDDEFVDILKQIAVSVTKKYNL